MLSQRTAFLGLLLFPVVLISAKKLGKNQEVYHPPEHHHAEPSHSNVLKIEANSLKELIGKNSFVVVLFYAPWCGHCRRLAPDYTQASIDLKNERRNILLTKIDMSKENNQHLAKLFSLRGFPTLKIFKRNDYAIPYEYRGPRDAAGLVNHLQVERRYCIRCEGPPVAKDDVVEESSSD